MLIPFKFRLYPFPNQERELLTQLSELTCLWNYALEERCSAWKREKRSVTYVNQCKSLTHWRGCDTDGLGRVNAQVAQECLVRLDDAFQQFFRRCKLKKERLGYPRFKRQILSFTYPQAYNSVKFVSGQNLTHRLHLSKIGNIPIEVHRNPPNTGLKTCTVKREGCRWFAILTYAVPDSALPADVAPIHPIGVDLGLAHLATLSNGIFVKPPKFHHAAEQRLQRAQRVVSRRKTGSHNREKARIRLARCYAKVRDQRRDFAHKLTTSWVRNYDLIAFEDMDLRSHMQGPFSKATADASWGFLRQFSAYKEVRRSGRYIEVPTKGTTQTCSGCGHLHDPPLTLKDRTYECPCGLRLDRDINAARNVLNRALAIVGRGTPESTPVEIGPPPARKGRRAWSKKQEPPSALGVAT